MRNADYLIINYLIDYFRHDKLNFYKGSLENKVTALVAIKWWRRP
jgi:hypothetical protein